jgi:hypothetical protein
VRRTDNAFSVYAMTYGVNFSGILSRDLCGIAAASRMPFAFLSLLTFNGAHCDRAICRFLALYVDGALTK